MILGVRKLPNIDTVKDCTKGRLSLSAAGFLLDCASFDPVDGSSCFDARLIKIADLTSELSAGQLKGNLLGDSKKRWGTVNFYRGSSWYVRARISQKEGLELTQALFLGTNTGFFSHKIHPFGFAVKRSYCLLGPFLTIFQKAIGVNALYATDDEHLMFMQCYLRENGKVLSRVVESKPSKHPSRFTYKMDMENPIFENEFGEYYMPDHLPVCSDEIHQNSNLPFFAFCSHTRKCSIYPTKNERWECSLSKNQPDYRKNIPSSRHFSLANFSEQSAWLTFQVNHGLDATEKRSPILSFANGLAGGRR